MAWVKLDDRFARHRKVRKLSDAAFRLHVSAMCWAAEEETGGYIPSDELALVSDVRRPDTALEELVDRHLWEVREDGWEIHDFADYNPTPEKAAEIREKRRLAGQRGGRASGQSRKAKPKQNASPLLPGGFASTGSKNEPPSRTPSPPPLHSVGPS